MESEFRLQKAAFMSLGQCNHTDLNLIRLT